MLTLIIFLVAIFAIWVIATYNRLVQLKNQVQNAWSQIDVQLQRRYDLIPNLVECVKGYMQHESDTLERVIQARNEALSAYKTFSEQGGPLKKSMRELLQAEKTLTHSMGSIFALSENYPELKASDNMKSLQEELSSTENKVSFSRQVYNDLVMTYNTKQEEFPALLFAKTFGHQKADLFEVSTTKASEAPKVTF
jgi:LemA protein